MPNFGSVTDPAEVDFDLVVSLRPSLDLRTQSGSSTPNPAPDSSGAACRRKPNAPSVSRVTSAGVAPRSASSSSGNSRAARPRPASSSSSGCLIPAARPAVDAPAQTAAAGITRLGPAVAGGANPPRQSSPGASAGITPTLPATSGGPASPALCSG